MDIRRSIKNSQNLPGIETLRKHQVKPINSILGGQDTMVIAPLPAYERSRIPECVAKGKIKILLRFNDKHRVFQSRRID